MAYACALKTGSSPDAIRAAKGARGAVSHRIDAICEEVEIDPEGEGIVPGKIAKSQEHNFTIGHCQKKICFPESGRRGSAARARDRHHARDGAVLVEPVRDDLRGRDQAEPGSGDAAFPASALASLRALSEQNWLDV